MFTHVDRREIRVYRTSWHFSYHSDLSVL